MLSFFRVATSFSGEAGSLFLGVSSGQVLAARHGQVELDFVVEFLFNAGAVHQRTQTQNEIREGHGIFPQANSSTLPMAPATRIQLSASCWSCFRPEAVNR